MNGKSKLGEMLLQAKLITRKQLQMALEFQKSVGGRLGEIIVKLGFLAEETLMNFIARQADLPVVRLEELVIPRTLVDRIPREFIETHQVVPIAYKDDILTVATSDPYDFEATDEIQLALNCKIEMNLATRDSIARTIQELFYGTSLQKEPPVDTSISGGPEPPPVVEPMTPVQQLKALIALLVEKGVIAEDELARKGKESS